jgi:hypothetical protein
LCFGYFAHGIEKAHERRISRRPVVPRRRPTMSSESRGPDPSAAPWPQYAQAVVELVVDGEHLVLTPCADMDAASGPAPAGSLAPWGPPVWVLTAGDPYPVELTVAENAARNDVLCAELDALGLRHDPALGRSPDGSTFEVSVAVRGADRASILALAARHGQLAVYELDDRIRCVDVTSGSVVTSVAYRLATAPPGSDALVGPTGWRG